MSSNKSKGPLSDEQIQAALGTGNQATKQYDESVESRGTMSDPATKPRFPQAFTLNLSEPEMSNALDI